MHCSTATKDMKLVSEGTDVKSFHHSTVLLHLRLELHTVKNTCIYIITPTTEHAN